MVDRINPSYYKNRSVEIIDCIESIIDGKLPDEAFLVGQCVKYIARYDLKNGLEDLQKVTWYLDRLKHKVEERQYGVTTTDNNRKDVLRDPGQALSTDKRIDVRGVGRQRDI